MQRWASFRNAQKAIGTALSSLSPPPASSGPAHKDIWPARNLSTNQIADGRADFSGWDPSEKTASRQSRSQRCAPATRTPPPADSEEKECRQSDSTRGGRDRNFS